MVYAPRRWKIMAAAVALSGLALFIDWTTPLGLADWALYLPVILLASRAGDRFLILITAACSLLALVDFLYSPEGVDPVQSILNRLMGVAAFCAIATVSLIDRRRVWNAIRTGNSPPCSRKQKDPRVERMRRLSELALTLSGDPSVVFENVVRIIGELFKVKLVCLAELADRPDGKYLVFKAAYIDGQVSRDLGECPLSITPCQKVFESRELRSFNNASALFDRALLLRQHHIDAYCGIPSLDNRGNVLAITCLLDDQPRDFSEEDRHLLRIIGQRIAVELERAGHLAEQERSQTRLRQINDELESIFRAYPDLNFILDAQGAILQHRVGDPRILYMSPEQFMGKPMQEVLPAPVGDLFGRAIRKVIAGEQLVTIDYLLPTDRGLRQFEARLVKLPDHRIAVQVRDTTDSHKAREEIKLLGEELAHLSRLGTLGEMASGLAHELNQPLTSLHNYASAAIELANRTDWEGVRDCLEAIAGQSLRAGQIVRHMRDFVRRGPSRRAPADLHHLIGEVLSLLQADLRRQHVEIELRQDPNLPRVVVNSIQIQQVLVNLIRNAIDSLSHQPPNSRRITLWTRLIDQSVAVRITDTGPGIAPSVAVSLFQPFKTTKPDGLGLGLAICRTLIESHGGSIGVASTSPGGATFHFTLPVAPVEIPA